MPIFEIVAKFFNSPTMVIISGVSTLVVIIAFLYSIYLVIKGVFPVWVRLGKGLSKRKIGLFAEAQKYNEMRDLLCDSNLFVKTNIIQVNINDIKKASEYTLLLVHYKSFKDCLDEILRIKKDEAALIVYAPQSDGPIDEKTIKDINNERNSIVVNMRGRLINDILTSMITTGYAKK